MRSYFEKFNILTSAEIEEFISFGVTKKLNKGDFFIKEGIVCKTFAFVKSGIIRSFYLTSSGDEKNYCFIFQDNMLGAYSSFITQQPTKENMQALTNVELILFSKEVIDSFTEKSMNWLRLMKTIAEGQYVELEKRLIQYQSLSAIERYDIMLKDHPEYILQIPLQHLSSYLGITQRHLSRLRTKVDN